LVLEKLDPRESLYTKHSNMYDQERNFCIQLLKIIFKFLFLKSIKINKKINVFCTSKVFK
jgi:hypothetical protein